MENFLEYTLWSDPLESLIESAVHHASSTKSNNPSKNAEVINPIKKNCLYAACLNPHSYCQAQADSSFRLALNEATWLLPDGIGVVIASKVLGGSISKRITGWDLFTALSSKINVLTGFKVFLLGSSAEVLDLMVKRFAQEYPNIQIVGVLSPPYKDSFSEDEKQNMVKAINLAQPDILWVAMTAPKQEKWIFEMRDELEVPFAAAVGAVFDFYSGKIHRPNRTFQKLGLEWLRRLLNEPKRLHHRMTVSAPKFVYSVLKARIKQDR
jgi:N-acetylglucosaminyldiphosphoundecaprenol N-acetyl-beta-D-mannosaminyltransferase